MADFAYECPWCGKRVDMTAFHEYEDLACEFVDEDSCPYCSKPVDVDIRISAAVYARKGERAMERERELYGKRMRGDWS